MPAPITSPATTAMTGSRAPRRRRRARRSSGPPAPKSRIASAEHDDPPGEQARARVVVVGELGGQRDVGHLEQAEGGRGGEEREEDPDAGCRGREPAGTANVSTKPTGSASAPTRIHVRRVPVAASARSLRSPIHGSITTSHTLAAVTTSAGDQGGHAEGVGQVEHEHEAGQRREAAGADRADRIAGHDAAGQGSLRCGHGGSVPTRTAKWVN